MVGRLACALVSITDFAMGWFSLAGKNAIVTGGNTGLGQAFSLALAAGGANVFVPSLADDDGTTRSLVEAQGVRYEFMQANITETGVPATVVQECVDRLGSIDVLINSAGICPLAEVLEFGREQWDPTVAVNLTASFEMSFEAAKFMVPQGSGKIINICSMMSELGRETIAGYAAAKGGLKMLTKNICSEFGEANIQCNGIGPGYIATPQTAPLRETQPDGSRHPFDQFIIAKTPAARWGTPEDLKGPAVFLASDASNFVNGHILYVDGGILAYIGKQPQ